jgi:TPR repeat protein/DNA-binding transcriptional ArsR family regulator
MDNIKKINLGNWFLDQLTVFQTANSDFQAVKDNFIVRTQEFERIISGIKSKEYKDPQQHELILGRRGSGKSTLLKRIELELIENPALNKLYIPINLAEEQAGIFRLFDLWEQVIYELNQRHNFNVIIPEFSDFNTEDSYTRGLYEIMHQACISQGKKIVLLLDNFDRIVENFTDDGSLLREILINYNEVQIIAGSTRMDEHFWSYDKPFYDFFRVHRLEALSKEEINLLLNHWSDALNIPVLKDFVKNNPGKIENVRILTDGLPRTLQFFIQIVLQNSETDTYQYLKKTMDNVSPLFQERLNTLTAPFRKIIYEMAFIWEACSVKQLVEKTKMESKLISAHLKTLVDKGLVDKIETSKKQHLYRVSERFFNMWIVVTQGNPEQKRKAKFLSIFLENWYEKTDLRKLAFNHIEKLKSGKIDYEEAIILSKAFSQSRFLGTNERDEVIEYTKNLKSKNSVLLELPEKFSIVLEKLKKLVENKDYENAIKVAETIENEEDGQKYFILAYLYRDQGNNEEAERYYLEAINKGHVNALNNLAVLYKNKGNNEEAEKYYLEAINKGHVSALYNLANLYKIQGKKEDVEKYYLEAINKGHVIALNNLANLYAYQGKKEEAEKYYLKAINKGYVDALCNLAIFYKNQDKNEKAEKYYLEAINNGNVSALYNLANLYKNQGKNEEAEKYYLEAINKGHVIALNNLANLYRDQANNEEAEKYYLEAINKGNVDALYNLANLYKDQDKNEEAEKFYLEAINKGHVSALYNLAKLYNDQGKNEEAEKYYLEAINKGDVIALNNLAYLYSDQGKKEEAEKYFLEAINKGHVNAINNLAILYYSNNQNKVKALNLIERAKEYQTNYNFKESKLVIEIWNGIFNNIFERALEIVNSKKVDVTKELLFDLLVQQQYTTVLNLFHNEEVGKTLQEKFVIFYYVTQIINQVSDENLLLRIPPEIKETVNEVLEKIYDEQKKYGYRL